jgi:acetylglutamate kinase
VGVVVQKYGGSSVADAAGVKRVAQRIADTRRAGNDVVVVVSAMGDTTDELIDLAEQVSPLPAPRELDMLLTAGERISMALLAMAIGNLGLDARSFTGSQAGVITDGAHGRAKIIDVTPGRIEQALQAGAIAIVAGFQGVSQGTKDITTLGRGGSDTTAVALAAALAADVCEIYSDVDGVFTADPRIVPTCPQARQGHLRGDARDGRVRGEDPAPAVRRVRPPVRPPDPRPLVVQQPQRLVDRRLHRRTEGQRHGTSDHRRRGARPQRGQDHRGRASPTRSARRPGSSRRSPGPASTST